MLGVDKHGYYIPAYRTMGVQYLTEDQAAQVISWSNEAKEKGYDVENYVYFMLFGE